MLISDKSQSLSTDGYTMISEYTKVGTGASLTTEMRSGSTPKKGIFQEAMPIAYAPSYTLAHFSDETTGVAFDYGA